MTLRHDLELQARTAWYNFERDQFREDDPKNIRELFTTLSVYADELQQCDDLRGELIALDLGKGDSSIREERKRDLLVKWLGSDLASSRRSRSQYGLVGISASDDDVDLLAELVRSDAG